MGRSQTSAPALPTIEREVERQSRDLSGPERKVRHWIRENHGVLSRVAREFGLSVAFVQRVAYAREARSKGLKVEHRLKALGCPMIQKTV